MEKEEGRDEEIVGKRGRGMQEEELKEEDLTRQEKWERDRHGSSGDEKEVPAEEPESEEPPKKKKRKKKDRTRSKSLRRRKRSRSRRRRGSSSSVDRTGKVVAKLLLAALTARSRSSKG